MLVVDKYSRKYISICKARVAAQVSAYHSMAAAAKRVAPAEAARLAASIEKLEPEFFSLLVLELDHYFSNRTRAKEGNDGNALNEVRILRTSIMENDGVMIRDRSIAYDPEKSVLKFASGSKIKIDEAGFKQLASAYFAAMQERFT